MSAIFTLVEEERRDAHPYLRVCIESELPAVLLNGDRRRASIGSHNTAAAKEHWMFFTRRGMNDR
jgi:hypothetical protein